MSAYLVHEDTIDLLVSASAAWRLTFPAVGDEEVHCVTESQKAGQLLWDENARSVNARYAEGDEAPCYQFRPVSLELAAVGMPVAVLVLGSVRCLRYQSCETADYAQTSAAILLDRIEAEACRRLINTYDAPWGFTRSWMTERTNEIKAKVRQSMASA